jgi:hypothetical protein
MSLYYLNFIRHFKEGYIHNDGTFCLKWGHKYFKEKCPLYNCEVTYDRDRLEESDLVVVSATSSMSEPDFMPPKEILDRLLKTRIVFLRIESMLSSGDYNGNAMYKWAPNPDFDPNFDYLATKTRFAFILTSHCETFSQRGVLIAEMRKYANVDVLGKCGNLTCGVKNNTLFLKSRLCRQRLSREYMFALAFENSLCEDYITEKFFDNIGHDIVPVVYGHGGHDKWIPKSAYIDVRDFGRVEDLMAYLIYLSKNATAYNSYFKWRQFIVPVDHQYQVYCDMCVKLNLETFYGVANKTFNIRNTWNVKKKCLLPKFYHSDQNGSASFEVVNIKAMAEIVQK